MHFINFLLLVWSLVSLRVVAPTADTSTWGESWALGIDSPAKTVQESSKSLLDSIRDPPVATSSIPFIPLTEGTSTPDILPAYPTTLNTNSPSPIKRPLSGLASGSTNAPPRVIANYVQKRKCITVHPEILDKLLKSSTHPTLQKAKKARLPSRQVQPPEQTIRKSSESLSMSSLGPIDFRHPSAITFSIPNLSTVETMNLFKSTTNARTYDAHSQSLTTKKDSFLAGGPINLPPQRAEATSGERAKFVLPDPPTLHEFIESSTHSCLEITKPPSKTVHESSKSPLDFCMGPMDVRDSHVSSSFLTNLSKEKSSHITPADPRTLNKKLTFLRPSASGSASVPHQRPNTTFGDKRKVPLVDPPTLNALIGSSTYSFLKQTNEAGRPTLENQPPAQTVQESSKSLVESGMINQFESINNLRTLDITLKQHSVLASDLADLPTQPAKSLSGQKPEFLSQDSSTQREKIASSNPSSSKQPKETANPTASTSTLEQSITPPPWIIADRMSSFTLADLRSSAQQITEFSLKDFNRAEKLLRWLKPDFITSNESAPRQRSIYLFFEVLGIDTLYEYAATPDAQTGYHLPRMKRLAQCIPTHTVKSTATFIRLLDRLSLTPLYDADEMSRTLKSAANDLTKFWEARGKKGAKISGQELDPQNSFLLKPKEEITFRRLMTQYRFSALMVNRISGFFFQVWLRSNLPVLASFVLENRIDGSANLKPWFLRFLYDYALSLMDHDDLDRKLQQAHLVIAPGANSKKFLSTKSLTKIKIKFDLIGELNDEQM